jgi:hypothetical protein
MELVCLRQDFVVAEAVVVAGTVVAFAALAALAVFVAGYYSMMSA